MKCNEVLHFMLRTDIVQVEVIIMPDVFIRGLPDDVFAWLQQQARLANRTVPAEIRHILARLAHAGNQESAHAADRLTQLRHEQQCVSGPSWKLIRENRDR